MRVYLPATFPLLRSWLIAGLAEPAGPAYAVTPALREWYREGAADELEAVAQVAAAGGSVELLAADPDAPRRRVVLAVDADDSDLEPVYGGGDRATIRLQAAVPRPRWASALVDDEDAVVVVATAIANLARAAVGDEDARFALDEASAHELGWYAVQELPHLLADG
jgi:hypothetical protein